MRPMPSYGLHYGARSRVECGVIRRMRSTQGNNKQCNMYLLPVLCAEVCVVPVVAERITVLQTENKGVGRGTMLGNVLNVSLS